MKPHWLIFAFIVLAGTLRAETQRPNILVILADDLGFSDLGCYGSEISTPNLDSLAAGGLRFTQFYNTARCWPSRAALLTGYYAQQVRRDALPGMGAGGKGTRPAWAPLLPEFLNDVGYRCYHSGKWHIDGKPSQNGFAYSYEIGAKAESNYFHPSGTTEDGLPVAQTPEYYATTQIAENAIRCLRRHAQEEGAKPFFQYIAFTAPHFPLHAPAADVAKYKGVYQKGWNVLAAERHARQIQMGIARNDLPAMEREIGPPYDFPSQVALLGPHEINRPIPWVELSGEQREFQAGKMAIHAAMIDRMDQEIGRVLAQLKAMGAYENTLILFASDNGASAEMMVRGEGHDTTAPMGSASTFLCLGPGWSSAANTPFRRHKTWVHEGGISTPLIAHWPVGIQERGQLRHHPGHLVDIVPTLMELSGARKPAEIKGLPVPEAPGKSLTRVFKADDPTTNGYLWWQHEKHRAIRVADWKLVCLAGGQWELYDLSRDRGESQDLAGKMPDKVRELESLWNKHYEETLRMAFSDDPAARTKIEGSVQPRSGASDPR